ncbi:MAG: energy transducer TonB [Bacteroidales bacterium]|nr:energy transducer TonB [Bacteroidales bacterium]
MNYKKTECADIENKRFILGEIGLVISLLIVWGVFESGTEIEKTDKQYNISIEKEIVEEIPITNQNKDILPPTIKQEIIPDYIEIKNDSIKIDNVFIFNEIEENSSIEIKPQIKEEPKEIEEEDIPFVVVENMPEFKGGDKALIKYIAENVKYPEKAKQNDIQGKVFIKFVVNEKGKVTNVELLKGIDPLLDKAAIDVVSSLPDWKPGRQSGKNVKVSLQVPINFKIAN